MTTPSEPSVRIDDKIADLWQRNLPTLRARVDLLTRAAEAARTHTLDEALRAEAHTTAHQLAGSLGMFGHVKAGQIAGQLERLYASPTPLDPTPLTAQLHKTLFPNP